ncbi:MAG: class D sortase [Heyndrickxia sp.]
MKRISYIFIFIGLICLLIGGRQLYKTSFAGKEAISKATEIISDSHKMVNVKNHEKRKEKNYKSGSVMGLLEIPALKKKIPIIEGTEPSQLEKGVGHYTDTALPGGQGQVFLAGHRDTVFRGLGNLKKGQKIIIKMSHGTFEYKMVKSKIVKSDDRSIIEFNAKKDSLVLATCYPFLFVGNAPDRYIIYAEPVKTT